jgi:diguanylate cyclase (GGDEF)-like protein
MGQHDGFLCWLLGVAVAAVLALPLYALLVVYPSMREYVFYTLREQALRQGAHMAGMLFPLDEPLGRGSLPEGLAERLSRLREEFGFLKARVFSPQGEVLFSTEAQEVGRLRREKFFLQEVLQGRRVAKVIKRGLPTLEGQRFEAAVVETYIPILRDGRLLGVLEVYFDVSARLRELEALLMRFSLVVFSLMLLLLGLVVVGFGKARASRLKEKEGMRMLLRKQKELQQANQELQTLYEVSRVIASEIKLQRLLQRSIQRVVSLPALGLRPRGGVMLLQEGRLKVVVHVGMSEAFLRAHQKGVALGQCLCGRAAKEAKVVLSENSHTDERHSIRYAHMEPHGHIIVPLKSGRELLGLMFLYLPAGERPQEQAVRVLETVAGQLAVAVVNARLYEQTRAQSLEDPLTGLANRRKMHLYLERMLSEASRYRTPLSVVLMDLDHFKDYNDTWGHQAGDELLRKVAWLLKDSIRGADLLVRYGGDEFLLLLPQTDFRQAQMLGRRLAQKVLEATGQSLSAGVATLRPGMTAEGLLQEADQALYQAKRQRRAQVRGPEV